MDALFSCCYPSKKDTIIIREEKFPSSLQVPYEPPVVKEEKGKSSVKEEPTMIKPSRNKIQRRSINENEAEVPSSISSFKSFNVNQLVNNLNGNLSDRNNMGSLNTENMRYFLTSLSNLDSRTNMPILEEDAKKAPLLRITEIEGEMLGQKELVINALGLEGSLRNKRDGVTLFGSVEKKDDIYLNDYVVNFNTAEQNEQNAPHFFLIFYRKEKNKYYIKAYKDNPSKNSSLPIVLVKLDKPHQIKQKVIFKISEMYFQVIPADSNQLELFKIEKSTQEKIKYVLNQTDSPVTIGRNKNCKIHFENEKSFSRIQCSLSFDAETQSWYLKDGLEKPSLNGTWLYAQHSYELQNDTLFRVYSSVLRINLIQQ